MSTITIILVILSIVMLVSVLYDHAVEKESIFFFRIIYIIFYISLLFVLLKM